MIDECLYVRIDIYIFSTTVLVRFTAIFFYESKIALNIRVCFVLWLWCAFGYERINFLLQLQSLHMYFLLRFWFVFVCCICLQTRYITNNSYLFGKFYVWVYRRDKTCFSWSFTELCTCIQGYIYASLR